MLMLTNNQSIVKYISNMEKVVEPKPKFILCIIAKDCYIWSPVEVVRSNYLVFV